MQSEVTKLEKRRRRKHRDTFNAEKVNGYWVTRLRVKTYDHTSGQLRTVSRAIRLCPVDEQRPTKDSVKQLVEAQRQRLNAKNSPPETIVKLGEFVERVWIPYIKESKAFSTYRDYVRKWQLFFKPRCTDWWLRDVRTCQVEQLLKAIAAEHRTKKGEPLSTTTLQHVKAQLSGIFTYAKRLGYFDGSNPVQGASIPKGRPRGETHAYSLEEILQILPFLPEPARTIIAAMAFTGMSLSEVQGLRWEDYDIEQKEIRVVRSRVMGRDKETKTPYRRAPLPVIAPLATMLEMHRLRCGEPTSGPVFRNTDGNAVCLNNLRSRVVIPSLQWCKKCGKRRVEHHDPANSHEFELDASRPLHWYGYHAFRRGLATNLSRLNVSPKTVQAILRHANLSTTMIHYVKSVDADSKRAMGALESLVPTSFLNLEEKSMTSAARPN